VQNGRELASGKAIWIMSKMVSNGVGFSLHLLYHFLRSSLWILLGPGDFPNQSYLKAVAISSLSGMVLSTSKCWRPHSRSPSGGVFWYKS